VDRNWQQIRSAINSVATTILGKKTSKPSIGSTESMKKLLKRKERQEAIG